MPDLVVDAHPIPDAAFEADIAILGKKGRGCEQCGAEFEVRRPSDKGRFCSYKCMGAAKAEPQLDPRPCEVCGTAYHAASDEVRRLREALEAVVTATTVPEHKWSDTYFLRCAASIANDFASSALREPQPWPTRCFKPPKTKRLPPHSKKSNGDVRTH